MVVGAFFAFTSSFKASPSPAMQPSQDPPRDAAVGVVLLGDSLRDLNNKVEILKAHLDDVKQQVAKQSSLAEANRAEWQRKYPDLAILLEQLAKRGGLAYAVEAHVIATFGCEGGDLNITSREKTTTFAFPVPGKAIAAMLEFPNGDIGSSLFYTAVAYADGDRVVLSLTPQPDKPPMRTGVRINILYEPK
jgi:hypothetical protein